MTPRRGRSGTGGDALPTELVARFDALDAELPPTPPWRPAVPAMGTHPAGAIRARWQPRGRAGLPVGTIALGTLVVAILVGGAGLASRAWVTAPAGTPSASGAPGGFGAGPGASPDGVALPPPASSATGPGPTATGPSARPPLDFAKLRVLDREIDIEAILEDDFGWICPVRLDAPTVVDATTLSRALKLDRVRSGLIKLADGQIAWVGETPEPAAVAFRASLVIRDGSGDLWILVPTSKARIQRLASGRSIEGTLVWWLADTMVVGTCPVPTPTVMPDPSR
jgi:hypothetical protein